MNKIYLTIDDGPSEHILDCARFLRSLGIDCVFFCRGDMIKEHEALLVEVIKLGFIVANHSYSHVAYTAMDEQAFFQEIQDTQTLIDACYQLAKVAPPQRHIRLPFGDRGAGAGLKAPQSKAEHEKVQRLQEFLKQNQFYPLSPPFTPDDIYIDAGWTIDPADYKSAHKQNPDAYEANLRSLLSQKKTTDFDVILLHDFGKKLGDNHALFERAITLLLASDYVFKPFARSTIKEHQVLTILAEQKQYLETRIENGQEYHHCYSRFFGGYSASMELKALNALSIAIEKQDWEDLETMHPALLQGELKPLYRACLTAFKNSSPLTSSRTEFS